MPAAAKRELDKYAATLPEGDTLPQPTAADSSEPISQVPGTVYKDPAGQSQPAAVPICGSTRSSLQRFSNASAPAMGLLLARLVLPSHSSGSQPGLSVLPCFLSHLCCQLRSSGS